MRLVVLIAALLVVVSKLCDVLTTIRYVGRRVLAVERNGGVGSI